MSNTWEQRMFEKTTGTGAGLVEQGLTPHAPPPRAEVYIEVPGRLEVRPGEQLRPARMTLERTPADAPALERAVLVEAPTPGSEGRGLPNEPAAPRKKRASVAPVPKKARR